MRCDERSFRRSIDIEIYGVVVNPERNSATSPPEVLYIFFCPQQFTRKLLKLGNGIMDIIIFSRKLKDPLFSAAKGMRGNVVCCYLLSRRFTTAEPRLIHINIHFQWLAATLINKREIGLSLYSCARSITNGFIELIAFESDLLKQQPGMSLRHGSFSRTKFQLINNIWKSSALTHHNYTSSRSIFSHI